MGMWQEALITKDTECIPAQLSHVGSDKYNNHRLGFISLILSIYFIERLGQQPSPHLKQLLQILSLILFHVILVC